MSEVEQTQTDVIVSEVPVTEVTQPVVKERVVVEPAEDEEVHEEESTESISPDPQVDNSYLEMLVDSIFENPPQPHADTKQALCVKLSDVVSGASGVAEKQFPFVPFTLLDRMGDNGCENDLNYLQIIPYTVCFFVDANNVTRVLSYKRGSDSDETRLLAKRSIGIGGHVDFCLLDPIATIEYNEDGSLADLRQSKSNTEWLLNVTTTVAYAAAKELSEELGLELDKALVNEMLESYLNGNLVLITPNDKTSDVDKHHLGYLSVLRIDPAKIKVTESNTITDIKFLSIEDVSSILNIQSMVKPEFLSEVYENWSTDAMNTISNFMVKVGVDHSNESITNTVMQSLMQMATKNMQPTQSEESDMDTDPVSTEPRDDSAM